MAKKSNNRLQQDAAANEKKPKAKTTAVAMAEKQAKQQKAAKKQKQKQKGRLMEYFRGVKLEMRKVVWPTRKELGAYTVVVLTTCAAFALLFWGVDSGVLAAIKALCF